MNTVGWFDQKYARGGNPNYLDVAKMLKESERARIPDRVTETLEDELRDWLFAFEARGGYTPSRQLNICIRINELAQLTSLKEQVIEIYIERYKRALEKHGDQVVFKLALEREE